MHSAPYFAILGLLGVFLSIRVIRLRRKHLVSLGDGGRPDLERAVRVFGNFTEYVPLGLILLVALEFVQAPVWYLHVSGGLLLVGRILHAIGLSQPVKGASPGRVIGITLTLSHMILASVGVLIFSVILA